MNSSKAKKELDWQPEFNSEETIRKFLKIYKKH